VSVTAVVTDPDGNKVTGSEDVDSTVVVTPPPSTDAQEVAFS